MTAHAAPDLIGAFDGDAAACSHVWATVAADLAQLPPKPQRGAAHAALAAQLLEQGRAMRDQFLRAHAAELYDRLTVGKARSLRLDALAYAAAELVPGLAPTRERVAAEAALPQKDKDGAEIDQGLLLAHVLAAPEPGRHLCHAMLLPRPESAEQLARLQRDGVVELATASIVRQGRATVVEMRNPRFLNAEDDGTLDDFEIAIDLAIMDDTPIAVLRGGHVAHPKYAGRRVFCAGINLTHLYHGRIPFLWFLRRDLGPVNKIFRGLATPGIPAEDPSAATHEKPWIAAVDTFAIGGGCQLLLVMDYVLAARGAYLTLPARKEGIIPGAANLRLPRFTGDRIARQLICNGRRLDCDSPEGRLVCDEIAAPDDMDDALAEIVGNLTASGAVSLVGNRRALRVGAEPLDVFREYMATYAREQAFCHFSPQLIANLEQHWRANQRRA
jgi:(3,5-dihydroxyphenyl)acetyl-CoA 1,2-dioxygenase